jgi:hypothetical protein
VFMGLKKRERTMLMRLTIDRVNLLPRPFFMYWGTGLINWCLKRVYARLGMTVVSRRRHSSVLSGKVDDTARCSNEKEPWSALR